MANVGQFKTNNYQQDTSWLSRIQRERKKARGTPCSCRLVSVKQEQVRVLLLLRQKVNNISTILVQVLHLTHVKQKEREGDTLLMHIGVCQTRIGQSNAVIAAKSNNISMVQRRNVGRHQQNASVQYLELKDNPSYRQFFRRRNFAIVVYYNSENFLYSFVSLISTYLLWLKVLPK